MRAIGDLAIAPAHADRPNRRFHRRNSGGDGQAENALKRAQQDLQQAEAAKRRLQDVEAALKRINQVKEAVAAQQARLQQMQAEVARKSVQLPPPASIAGAERHRAALERTMAKLRHIGPRPEAAKQQAPQQTTSASRHQALIQQMTAKLTGRRLAPGPTAAANPAGVRHQVLLLQVMSKLRRHPAPGNHARIDGNSARAAFNANRHVLVLQTAMNRLRARHAFRDHGSGGYGHHGSRQHAIFSSIRQKLSRHGWRSKEAPKETVAATPPPTTTTTTTTTTTKTTKTTGLSLDAPDLRTLPNNIGSKLPDVVASANTRNESGSDNNNGMSRLGGPRQPSDDDDKADGKGASRSKTQKKDDGSDDVDGQGKSGERKFGRRVVRDLLPQPGSFRPNEVLAKNLKAADLEKILQRDFKVLEKIEFPALGLSLTRLATPETQNAVIGRSTLNEVLPAEDFSLNHIYVAGRPTTGPVKSAVVSPPRPGADRHTGGGACASERCFGVSAINWQPQLAACARGIKIGMIDTGIDESHPAFAGVPYSHKAFLPANGKKPSNQHGTGIFSLLAGNARSSTPGLVPDATFVVVDAFYADRNGNAMSDTVTMLKALSWLKTSGVDIANLSFAGPEDELVHEAITALAKTGAVILAAAGNDAQEEPSFPAGYREVIAVTAVDRNLAPYVYANRGKHIDVAAPGVDVWTALPNRREGPQTGTSFAVPFVTSVVALNYRAGERSAQTDPLAPKRMALALLQKDIKALGGRGRSPIFGAGLVQAPSHCDPGGSATVASVKVDGWKGTVEAAPLVVPLRPPQAGSWTSTVHPAATRK